MVTRWVVVVAMVLASACSPEEPVASDEPTTETSPAPTVAASATPVPTPSLAPVATPTPSPPPPAVVRDAFDGAFALDVATQLASLGTRDAGTPGDVAAQAFLQQGLTDAGWDVTIMEVALPQGGHTANLIATLGAVDLDQPHLVVGGHLDTVGGSPGANDNGSGLGVLVALARELADEAVTIPVPIVLVAFGAEEYQPSTPREHHLGSDAYAQQHADAVVAAFIIDMVGDGPDTCICWFDAGPRTLADRLQSVGRAREIEGLRVEARGDISDHGPFALRGIPAAFLWTGRDGRLHTPQDTAEHLQLDDMQRAGDLALAFLRDLRVEDLGGLQPDASA